VLDELVDRETAANAATNRHDFLVALEAAIKRREDELEESDGRQAAQLPSANGLRTTGATAEPREGIRLQ
jgi:hypothetical protein